MKRSRSKPRSSAAPLARPNVTPPPPGPRSRTWVRGVLLITPTGFVSVGGEPLARAFREFDFKKVKVTLEVLL